MKFAKHATLTIACAICLGLTARATPATGGTWTTAWFTSQQLTERSNEPPAPGLAHATLRQIILPTLGGERLRVTFSNAFGHSPLVLTAAHVAVAAERDAIDTSTDHALRFHGQTGVVIQPGASMISDPLDLPIAAQRKLAITVAIAGAPAELTGHPGSRTTSYFCPGDLVGAAELSQPASADHWYFVTAMDVRSDAPTASIVALGDSITDGRGSTTNANNRWTDELARRLQANASTSSVAVLNAGIGGNRLLRDGLGPNALARFDRDVLAPAGVRWLIVFEGINDIGTRHDAGPKGLPFASADDIVAAYEQMIVRAHAHGIRVIGATITPYEGANFYFTPDGEADRAAINRWIRTSGAFDAVIDFDAAIRDAQHPTRLAPEFDSGDHLHPSPAGYRQMAAAIDLRLFETGR